MVLSKLANAANERKGEAELANCVNNSATADDGLISRFAESIPIVYVTTTVLPVITLLIVRRDADIDNADATAARTEFSNDIFCVPVSVNVLPVIVNVPVTVIVDKSLVIALTDVHCVARVAPIVI